MHASALRPAPQCPSVTTHTPTRLPRTTDRFNFGVGENAHGELERHDDVWIRYSLDPKEPWTVIPLVRRPGAVASIDADQYRLYAAPLKLDPKKQRDLAKMRAWLKPEFHALYPDVPPVHAAAAAGGAGGLAGVAAVADASDSDASTELSAGAESGGAEDDSEEDERSAAKGGVSANPDDDEEMGLGQE
jgi:hypothetical protein